MLSLRIDPLVLSPVPRSQSPALHTISRARPPRFVSTEEAEAAALAALPPFAARPVRCAAPQKGIYKFQEGELYQQKFE